ncbi:hypothetical protein AUR64_03825 [Haloprofundus marisrubri]|uniref:DEAD/DEAH box helicase n=1 Tax=Haloprofundus marisrubri TaxID=1514971 RepID=A0A0W1RDB5_9EURY|nr:DEAD/DEAH box helicase [Haloprofundus marisrubri]KTG11394.1 hypothetical protein AUR64_03825 [Haloprofundus marisrubri]
MQFVDRNTNFDRIDPEVRPLITGMLLNQQILGPDHESPSYVTSALKYTQQRQKRRNTSEYTGDDEFVKKIIEIFDFPPLDFQVNSWQTIDNLAGEQNNNSDTRAAILSAPTGFGKTEAFLGPLYQLLLEQRQTSSAIVYPSRALLQDQLGRVLEHLHDIRETTGERLSVGVYVGKMPYKMEDVETNKRFFKRSGSRPRFKLSNCWCGGDGESNAFEYHGNSQSYVLKCENEPSHCFTDEELVLSRRDMINGEQPDIILTTLESLELFGLKPNYDLVDNIDTIVLDEVHLYTGLRGAHTANIIQNINHVTEQNLLWIGSSATIDDMRRFGEKIFGVSGRNLRIQSPPPSDFDQTHTDKEHYHFLLAPEDGPGASSMAIQQLMLLGHSLLENDDSGRSKLLSFIDSISQVNQKHSQLVDADSTTELWKYHTGDEIDPAADWRNVASEMDHTFIEEPLDFLRVYSDEGFDADSAADSDVLLSTSFLEVGIDVGEINIVSQYRTPWDLSSFIQRAGRAARKEGMDSHILVFLSNLTSDANMFYRADRFLGSEIRTPLKTDNEVVEWIHNQFRSFHRVSSEVHDNRHDYLERREEELAFLEQYLVDELEYQTLYKLITEPDVFFSEHLSTDTTSEPLLSEAIIKEAKADLRVHLDRLAEDFEDIEEFFDLEDGQVVRTDNAVDSFIDVVRERTLQLIQTYEDRLDEYEAELRSANDPKADTADEIREELSNLRTGATSTSVGPVSERVMSYSSLLAELYGHVSKLMMLRNAANQQSSDTVSPLGMEKLNDVQQAVTQLESLAEDSRIQEYFETQKQVYYLEQSLEQLSNYVKNDVAHYSLYFVKSLLRSAYYLDRFLRIEGKRLGDEVWYVPPSYFEDSGKYVTVFENGQQIGGQEESIDSLVTSLVPYRSEYQATGDQLKMFLPKTDVVKGSIQFDFDDIPGEERDGVLIPDSITTEMVTDLSGERALNIVQYCPECLSLTDGRCLRHNEIEEGKIHADPEVRTTLQDRQTEDQTGHLQLADVTGRVSLEGVSLQITPASYFGSDSGYGFDGRDRIEREITSPSPPLGFVLDTRSLIFGLGDFISSLDEEVHSRVARHKNFDDVSFEYVVYHTAAHFFLQLISDVSSVNTTMLFYGMDESKEEVFVFERTEGGQGVVDLVYDEIENDPARILEAITRIGYNPQVMNESIWSDSDFIMDLSTTSASEESIDSLLKNYLDLPYQGIRQQVVQEIISTHDRAEQLAKNENIELLQAYNIKHCVASEQIKGCNSFPRDAVAELEFGISDYDRVKTLFYSPDIDGCVENLQLSECISGHDQSDALSYIIVEELREFLIDRVPSSDASKEMFDREAIPAGEFNDTSIFISF